MPHLLIRIATLVTFAGSATALFVPIALGQSLPGTPIPPPPLLTLELQFPGSRTWIGRASCTITGSSHSQPDYSGTETHTWQIIPWLIYTNGSMTFYAETWTATGSGKNNKDSWTVNATGRDKNGTPIPGYLQFWLPPNSNLLNIKRWSDQQVDFNGSVGGQSAEVGEPAFPGPVSGIAPNQSFGFIVADQNVVDSVKSPANVTATTTGAILSNEPGDGVNDWTCNWDFEYPPLHLQPLPPKSLMKPDLLKR
jgi:hypothetical protein